MTKYFYLGERETSSSGKTIIFTIIFIIFTRRAPFAQRGRGADKTTPRFLIPAQGDSAYS